MSKTPDGVVPEGNERDKAIEAAQEIAPSYGDGNDVEVEEDAEVHYSMTPNDREVAGYWVAAWLFVPKEGAYDEDDDEDEDA